MRFTINDTDIEVPDGTEVNVCHWRGDHPTRLRVEHGSVHTMLVEFTADSNDHAVRAWQRAHIDIKAIPFVECDPRKCSGCKKELPVTTEDTGKVYCASPRNIKASGTNYGQTRMFCSGCWDKMQSAL